MQLRSANGESGVCMCLCMCMHINVCSTKVKEFVLEGFALTCYSTPCATEAIALTAALRQRQQHAKKTKAYSIRRCNHDPGWREGKGFDREPDLVFRDRFALSRCFEGMTFASAASCAGQPAG